MHTLARLGLILFILAGNLSCSVNILENFADKETNEALYADAVMLINDGDYTGALAKIALMTGSYASERKVVTLTATTYAGLCGLRFLPLVDALAGMSTSRLFPVLMSHFRAGTTTGPIDYCVQAEDLVESLGTTAERTTDENMLLVLISFAKIGNVLSYYADTDQDGTVTAAYDVCAAGGARTAGGAMHDDDVRELGTGITLAIANISAVTSTVDLGDESLSDISAACADLALINASYDFCAVTDPTSFTADHLYAIRSLVKEDQVVGLDPLGAGCNGDVSVCECFPP